MEHIDESLSALLPEICSMQGNILITGNSNDERERIIDAVLSFIRDGRRIIEPDPDNAPLKALEALLDDKAREPGVVIIRELSDLLISDGGIYGEALLHRLLKKEWVKVIAATRYASAETLTPLIRQGFRIRISSQLSSGMNSRIVFGRYGAEALASEELMLRMGRKAFICRK